MSTSTVTARIHPKRRERKKTRAGRKQRKQIPRNQSTTKSPLSLSLSLKLASILHNHHHLFSHLVLPDSRKQIGRRRVRGELDGDHGLAVRLLESEMFFIVMVSFFNGELLSVAIWPSKKSSFSNARASAISCVLRERT